MVSNDRNSGNEFNFLVRDDVYKIRKYPENYFHSILDIGANIGFFSVQMRMLHPRTRIVAVEPCIETCRYLRQNLNMMNVSIEEKALGTVTPLYFNKGRRGKHEILGHIFSDDDSANPDTYRVESITLKQLNDKYKVRRPYALKINCEGGEKSLIDDRLSRGVLKKADFIGMMVHYKSDTNTSYSGSWISLEDYDKFLHDLLGQSHYIERHHESRNESSVYSIHRDKRFM